MLPMKLPRFYNLSDIVRKGKVLIIFGPRQVGKTTMLQDYLDTVSLRYKLSTGDDINTQNLFAAQDLSKILEFAEGYELIAIDEAQRIPNIGIGLKMLIDHRKDIYVIATGSSSFEFQGQLGEPLTGRKRSVPLFPIAQLEMKEIYNESELKEMLNEFLIYGGYPDVITAKSKDEKINILDEIAGSYLLKDILEIEKIKSSKILLDLLRLIAFQIGNEVSLSEIATKIGINYKTVARYLDLLEKSYILYNVRGFSKNLRKEVVKKSKYYFYDNGIRNALIANFNDINLRNDVGQLWENFVFTERMKKRNYSNIKSNVYFWRTWDKKEIDIIEEREGKLFAFECKWSERKRSIPRDWQKQYPEADFVFITKENYLNFVT